MAVRVELLSDPIEAFDELAKLRRAWTQEQGRTETAGDSFSSDLRAWLSKEQGHRRFWIVSVNDLPVGMVNLLVFDRMPTVGAPSGGWGYLCNMYVQESHRNSGLGAQLAAAVLDYADTHGLERVVLSPSERSVSFYGSLGFGPADQLLVRPVPTPDQPD